MTVDVASAEQFIYSSARLLDRHRLAVLLHGAPTEPVLAALAAYRNPDGGYGHALEPDARGPYSETTATLHALKILDEVGAPADSMADAAAWVAAVALPDGGVPFVLPTAAGYPLAPWMVADGGSHVTFGLAAVLGVGGVGGDWLAAADEWCWNRLSDVGALRGYWLKYALEFLDRTADVERAERVIESIRPLLRPDGSVPVQGGTADESLSGLTLSPHPGTRSRTLFTDDQIAADLDTLEAGQQDDGGWTFDWAAWAPAQSTEWRGLVTLTALQTLHEHGRIG